MTRKVLRGLSAILPVSVLSEKGPGATKTCSNTDYTAYIGVRRVVVKKSSEYKSITNITPGSIIKKKNPYQGKKCIGDSETQHIREGSREGREGYCLREAKDWGQLAILQREKKAPRNVNRRIPL